LSPGRVRNWGWTTPVLGWLPSLWANWGVEAPYPHKTIWRSELNGINLIHDEPETSLPHLQEQRLRELLPFPGRIRNQTETRASEGMIYASLWNLPT
jgi:hypothetical protein